MAPSHQPRADGSDARRLPSDEERDMFFQFIVVLAAALGFPAAALLFLIGGPRFPDEPRGPERQQG